MTDRTWGVKCLTAAGWHGGGRPTRYTEAAAKECAERLNADPDERDTWEARRLTEPTRKGR